MLCATCAHVPLLKDGKGQRARGTGARTNTLARVCCFVFLPPPLAGPAGPFLHAYALPPDCGTHALCVLFKKQKQTRQRRISLAKWTSTAKAYIPPMNRKGRRRRQCQGLSRYLRSPTGAWHAAAIRCSSVPSHTTRRRNRQQQHGKGRGQGGEQECILHCQNSVRICNAWYTDLPTEGSLVRCHVPVDISRAGGTCRT